MVQLVARSRWSGEFVIQCKKNRRARTTGTVIRYRDCAEQRTGATPMPTSPMQGAIRHLREMLLRDLSGLTDGQLIDRFVATGFEAAFEEIVKRHGPMVLSSCRRIVGNLQDAEDAFQAVFLVLARKAKSISRK